MAAFAKQLTHYEVLGAPLDASPEQLKQAYHAAVLRCHPDKAKKHAGGGRGGDHDEHSTAGGDTTDTGAHVDGFARVQQAWEVLRDAVRRAEYDSHLSLRAMQDVPVSYQDELDLDELDEGLDAGGTTEYTYPCRCGDVYLLPKHDVPPNAITVVVPCRSCSNHILVRLPHR